MKRAATFYGFRRRTATLLTMVLAFAVASFGAADRWAWTLVAVTTLGICAVWAYRRFATPYPFVWSWFYLPLGMLAGAASLQGLLGWTADRHATAGAATYWITLLAWFVLWVNTLEDASIRHDILRILPWLGGAVAALGIVQHFTTPQAAYWFREAPGAAVFAMFANRNHFVFLMELLFPAAVFLALQDHGRQQIPRFMLCAALMGAVFVSGSQIGFLLLLTELVIALVIHLTIAIRSHSRRRRARMLLSASALTFVAVLLVLGTGSFRAFEEELGFDERLAQDRTVQGMSRSAAAQGVWLMIEANPLFGHGAGAFGTAFSEFSPYQDGNYWNHAQSDPLELAAEMGVTGAGAQVLIFGLAVARRRRAQVWMTSILPLGIVWIHSLTEFPLQTPALPMTALVLLALIPTDGGVAVRSSRGTRKSAGWNRPKEGVATATN